MIVLATIEKISHKSVQNSVNNVQSQRTINHGERGTKDWKTKLGEMDGYEFEKFVAELFEEIGYETEVTPRSNDQGVNIIAETPL